MTLRELAIRKLMPDAGLKSIRAYARKSEVSESLLRQWLANKDISDEYFEKLAKGLGLSPEQLRQILESGDLKVAV